MKKIIKELKSQNILYYIFAFSAVIILIITVMGAYLYHFYYQTIYSDFQAANKEHVRTMMNHHESALQIVEDIGIQIGLSEDITKFDLAKSPEKAGRLKKQMYQYTMVSHFFEMMLYHYHGDMYIYNHSTSAELDFFLEQGCVLELTGGDEFRKELDSREKYLRVLPEQAFTGEWARKYFPFDEKMIVFIQSIAPEFEDTLAFFVPGSYYDTLLEKNPENLRSDFIIGYGKGTADGADSDSRGQVIVSRGGLSAENEELLSLIEPETGQKKVKLGGETCLMTVEEGESGLLYCSLQSMDVFYDKILSGQWGIVMLVIVLAIPTTLFLLIVSRRLIAKIRKLNKMLDTREDNYSISDIESGISMLVASNEQKEKESRLLKKIHFIRNFVRGDYRTEEEIKETGAEAGVLAEGRIFTVVLLGKRSDSNDNKAHLGMLEMIERENGIDGYGIHLVGRGQSLFALFGDTREQLETAMQGIFAVGKESYEEFVMSASGFHTLLTEGPKAYLEADTAFDNRFLQDNSQIIYYKEVKEAQSGDTDVLSDAYLQKLRYAIKSRNREAVSQAITDICRRMTEAKPSLYTFRLIYNDILHILITEWKGQKEEAESLYNVFTLSQCLTIRDFNELLMDACRTVIDSGSQEEPEKGGADVISRATAYLQENFASSQLTMAALADYLEISSVTLAVVFKNSMGIRPSDYLANLRMEHARELLTSTNMLIREISLAVGYEDDHVFTRRFKKYTGMTPGQYREEYS